MESLAAERYRPLGALASAAAYVDREGTILCSNEAFDTLRRELSGDASLEGSALSILFVPEDRGQVRELLAGAGSRVRRALRSVAAGGTDVTLTVVFAPIRRRLRHEAVWLVTLRPSEAALQISSELAAKAALTERYIDDLRTPVQDVLGWGSLLRRSRDEPERVEQALATIERNAAVLMVLLQNLVEQAQPPRSERAAGSVDSSQVA